MSENRTEISSLGEFGLIEHLTRNIELQNASTVVGVGDDAAVIDRGRIAWTGDAAALREDSALRQRLLGVH